VSATVTDLAFAPLLPLWLLIPFAVLAAGLLLYGFARCAPGTLWRAVTFVALALALANPSIVRERREALPDVALVVVDRSASQSIGERDAQSEAALAQVMERLGRLGNIDIRTVAVDPVAAAGEDALPGSGTRLFGAISRALADVPREAISVIVMITDGAVHDAPETLEVLGFDAPVHVLLTGARGESDRRIELLDAPRYGIVDKPLLIAFRVIDEAAAGGSVPVTLTIEGQDPITYDVPVGERYEARFAPDHAGISVVRLDAAQREGELTPVNNGAVIAVNGIRENLKVLLISGEVHSGERVWRNSLKSDTSVELVHFTILRPPEKPDNTPIRELALISFPVRELFEVKLNEFDLIIFDRYRKRGVIPEGYLQAIADYVLAGGAMLIAAGPDFATPLGLHNTVLGELMPLRPSGVLLEEPFRVVPTDIGLRHPVTAELPGIGGDPPPWGHWYRQVDAEPGAGDVLLDGAQGRPLLVLSRAGEGRVAELLSDQMWLWARGWDGGGPSQELLRRLAHWLMKEPELEENAIRATARGNRIVIVHQSLEDRQESATVIAPSGAERQVVLEPGAPGRAMAELTVGEAGLFRIVAGELETVVSVGELNPLEWRSPEAGEDLLAPIAEATGGRITWIADDRLPSIRHVDPGRDRSGQGWIGMLDHARYIVRGIDSLALLPSWLALLLFVGGLAAAWRAEGR
jgi:hypothetical protein